MKTPFIRILQFGWAFFLSVHCYSQAPEFFFDHLTSADGLSSDKINSIVQDHTGFIWIATSNGLNRYDGHRFKTFFTDLNDSSSLPDNRVRKLFVDSKKNLWLCSYAGVSRYNPNTESFENYFWANPENIKSPLKCNDIVEINNEYWVASLQGVLKINLTSQRLEPFFKTSPSDFDSTQSFYGLQLYNNKVILAACFKGIAWLDIVTRQFKLIKLNDGISIHQKPDNSVNTILKDTDNQLWLGTWSGGLKKYDAVTNKFSTFLFSKKPAYTSLYNIVLQILPSQQNNNIFWIASSGEGLWRFDKTTGQFSSFITLDPDNRYGIPPSGSGCLFEDRQSRLWIGGENGIFIYDPLKQFIRSKNPEWLINRDCLKDIISIYQDPADQLHNTYWVSTWTCGIFKTDSLFERNEVLEGPVQTVNRFLIQKKYSAEFFLRDRHNNLWIAAGKKGLFIVNENKRTIRHFGEAIPGLNKTDSFPGNSFLKILEDKKGTIWVSGYYGLFYFDTLSQLLKNYFDLPQENFPIADLTRDNNGNIWFIRQCSNNHDPLIFCIDSKSGKRLSFKEPFMERLTCLSEKTLKKIFVDENNILWLSSSDGLIRAEIRTNRLAVEFFSEKNSSLSSGISQVQNGGKGYLWITTNNGLSLFNRKNGKVEKNYSVKDGLYVSYLGYMYKDNNNHIYIDGESGSLNIINANQKILPVTKLPVIITGIRLFNREFLPATGSITELKELYLNYRQNNVQIEFAALDYTNPSDQQFFYKLDGINSDWVETRQPFAIYNNLAAGEYNFRIKARSSPGTGNEDETVLKLIIRPPFWKTVLFKGLIALLLLALTYWLFKLRIAQVKKEEQLKRQKTDAEIKALRAQMNPHFIFNCMNTIDAYILKNKQDEASDILQKFSELMRQVLENSRHDKVLIEKEMKSLELYVNLEEYILDKKFSHEIRMAPVLLENSYVIPPLVLQPYVENAILHGLLHKKTRDGLLSLTLELNDHFITCIIEDNGIGRKQSAGLKKYNFQKTESLGMQVTKERIEKLNNLQKNKITLDIIDIEEGDKTGTRVVIRFPAEKQ